MFIIDDRFDQVRYHMHVYLFLVCDDFIQTKQQGQQKKEGAKTKDTTNVLFLNSSMTRTNQLVIFNIIIISMMFKWLFHINQTAKETWCKNEAHQ